MSAISLSASTSDQTFSSPYWPKARSNPKAWAARPENAAKLAEFTVVSVGNDSAAQITAIDNYIAAGYDAIVFIAVNPTAFNITWHEGDFLAGKFTRGAFAQGELYLDGKAALGALPGRTRGRPLESSPSAQVCFTNGRPRTKRPVARSST